MGWSDFTLSVDNNNSGYIVGRVIDIVLSESVNGVKNLDYSNYRDVGKIKVQILYSPITNGQGTNVDWAYPMAVYVKQYPVLNEIVYMFLGPSISLNDNSMSTQLYYMPSYAIWNNVNHNAFPDLNAVADSNNRTKQKPGYNAKKTNTTKYVSPLSLGNTFVEKNIKPLRVFEGDTLLESRYGQSIRLGSTIANGQNENNWSTGGINGDPILIIRNGEDSTTTRAEYPTTVENINKDKSSIYLTSTQNIYIDSIINREFPLDTFDSINIIDTIQQNVIAVSQPLTSNYSSAASDQDNKTLNV
jgi:hypothetical protein